MATRIERFHCTTCPRECELTVRLAPGLDTDGDIEVESVSGNRCPRGDAFARQEVTCPVRVLTTTVVVARGWAGDDTVARLLPVRTAGAIPLSRQHAAMDELRGVTVRPPIRMGDVVLDDVAGTGVAVVASCDLV